MASKARFPAAISSYGRALAQLASAGFRSIQGFALPGKTAFAWFATSLLVPGVVDPVAAQSTTDKSLWGITGSLIPQWRTSPGVNKILFQDDDVRLRGSEFEVGIVRGRVSSGDWGVSFFRKSFSSESRVEGILGESCFGTTVLVNGVQTGTLDCRRLSFSQHPSELTLTGVEIHKFLPFATINRRAQVGINVAAGIAQARGGFERTTYETQLTRSAQGSSPLGIIGDVTGPESTHITSVEQTAFSELLRWQTETIPLGRFELAAAAIINSHVKIRASGGLNLPGIHSFALSAIYLFGS